MKKYLTGIDGLRTLGVLAVIFYHITPNFISGGYLGVLIFFVISGYLVTDSLLREHKRNKKIDWKNFALKRVLRLYPLLLTVFFVASLCFFIFQPKMLTGMRASFLSSVLSVNNWWQIFNGSSYFANFAQSANNAFKHIYFLSIEGQFYLILAFLLSFLPRSKKNRMTSFTVVIILSILSAVLMGVLFKGSDPTRVYYGTDTRLFGLLIGVALAFVFRRDDIKLRFSKHSKKPVAIVASTLTLLIVAAMLFLSDKSPFVYHGGMYLFCLMVAALVYLLAHPSLNVDKYYSNPVFSYIGSRSYGIYLWQLPVLVFIENMNINASAWYNVIWELALITLLAELSYRLVEEPAKKITFDKARQFFSKGILSYRTLPYLAATPLILASLIVMLSAPAQAKDIKALQDHISKAKVNNQNRNKAILEEEASSSSSSSSSTSPSSTTAASSTPKASQSQQAPATESSNALLRNAAAPTAEALAKAQNIPVAAVGDSVLLDVSDSLQHNFPKMYINGDVGRHSSDGVPTFNSLPAPVLNGSQALLVNLSINGNIAPADIDGIMQIANGRPVYWVNCRVPRPWQDPNNTVLNDAAKRYKNLHIVDWYSVSAGHPDYFVSDQVHLTSAGIAAYSNMVTNAIAANN